MNAYSDADWGGDLDNRRSRSGYVIFLGKGPIVWCSKLQKTSALSSMEAEYIALSSTTQDVIWCRMLLTEMGFKPNTATTIFEDNASCITVANYYKSHAGLKHMEIRHHFIRDRILVTKDIMLEKKATGDMVADLFTKQLPYPAFSKHRAALQLKRLS
jgi:hypothetical protein